MSGPSTLDQAPDFDCIRSSPGNDNKFTGISYGSLKLVDVPTTRLFFNNHLARVPVTPNQEGTMGMRDQLFSSVGAQNTDASVFEVSDMDNVELYREKDRLDVDAVFGPGFDTPFPPTALSDLEMGGSAENPNMPDEEKDKKNSHPTIPVSERPTRRPGLPRSHPFGTRKEHVPDYVYKNLFQ